MANIANFLLPVKIVKGIKPRSITNKQLRWLIHNPPETPIKACITPGLAEEMLTYNLGNRTLKPGLLRRITHQMCAGFPELFPPIVFSDAFKLRDGQHRLTGCKNSNCAFVAWIAFGDADENFAFMDIGGPRGAGDIFELHGVPNWSLAASITRGIANYDNHLMHGQSSGFVQFNSPEEQYQLYLGLGDDAVQASCAIGNIFGKNRMPFPSQMATMHFVCARKSRRQADEFGKKVGTGLGFSSTRDKARKLREHLLRIDLHRIPAAGDYVTAWNAVRLNQPVGKWFSSTGGVFPTVI